MSVDGGSSHGGSSRGSVGSRAQGQAGKDDEPDSSNFWTGIYGVLYTVSKERKTTWAFFCIKYTLDFLQLFLLMANTQYGWQFDTSLKMWKFMQILQVQPFMTQLGYTAFIVLLYIFAALLLVNVAICVWTFYSFQSNSFGSVWPIQFLRIFGYIFYQVLDIMSLSLFLTATDCQYWGVSAAVQYHNNEFPHIYCWSMPHLVHFTVGVISIIIFLFLAGMFIAAEMQLNPLTTNNDANAHSLVEVTAFGIKAVMTLSQDFLTYKFMAIVWLIGSAKMAYMYWKWEPMVVGWVNYLRVGTYFSITWCACVFMMLQFPPDSVLRDLHTNPNAKKEWAKTLEYALIGMVPAFGVGAAASWHRLRYFRVTVLNRFRVAPVKTKSRSLYRFTDAREVEILTRCCRKWTDGTTLDPLAVALAERVIDAGREQLPSEPFMIIWYSSFLIDVLGSYQSGFSQLQTASQMDLSFLDSFAIFSREQENTQKASGGGRAGQATDLVSFVEFQKNYRLAMTAHRDALLSLRYFWQLLLHTEVRFQDLTRAVRRIDRTVTAAELVYKAVLQRHSNSARILRMYAKFLERVKHDPWNASHYTLEAEKLDQQEEDARHNNLLGMEEDDGATEDIDPGQRVALFSIGPTGKERAVVVLNAHGVVLMANTAMRTMFGFAKAEIVGRNINIIMPPQFADQHSQTLKNFIATGRGAVVTPTTEFAAIHKERHMFSVKMTIVRISGAGEDSTCLAALEVVAPDPDLATVWVLPSGRVLSVDSTFTSWFGYSPAELENTPATALLASSEAKSLEAMLNQARFAMIRLGIATSAAAHAAKDKQTDAFDAVLERQATSTRLSASRSLRFKSSASLRVTDALTAALEQAAAPAPPPVVAEGPGFGRIPSRWTIRDVHMRHKFADAGDVDITISNRGGNVSSAFCMHVLSVRRTGPTAGRPVPHLLVTTVGGAVLHATQGLATALGTTIKALMANGSASALESMMVQPFALLHRSGPGRGGQPMLPGPPPPYSCRSGVSVLLPDADSGALPFSFAMKRRQGLDETFNVCTLQQKTWEQALDERSLRLVVDVMGMVRQAGPSPASLFGMDPASLLGRSLSCFIDVMRTEDGDCAQSVLAELETRLEDTPGISWRVGVGLQQAASVYAALPPTSRARCGQLRAAIMTVAVYTPARYVPPEYVPPVCYGGPSLHAAGIGHSSSAAHFFDNANAVDDCEERQELAAAAAAEDVAFAAEFGPCLELRLWRADLVTDVVEVDPHGIVVESEHYLQRLYPPGLALGASPVQMLGHHIRNFVPLGHGRRYMDLFEENVFPGVPLPGPRPKPTPGSFSMASMKRSSFRRQPSGPLPAGPPALLKGRHRGDGRELQIVVQIVRKGNAGAYLVVHTHKACTGHPNLQQYLMQKHRGFSACSSAAGLHHHGSQELTEGMIQAARDGGFSLGPDPLARGRESGGGKEAGGGGAGDAGGTRVPRRFSVDMAQPTVMTTGRRASFVHFGEGNGDNDPAATALLANAALMGASHLAPQLSPFGSTDLPPFDELESGVSDLVMRRFSVDMAMPTVLTAPAHRLASHQLLPPTAEDPAAQAVRRGSLMMSDQEMARRYSQVMVEDLTLNFSNGGSTDRSVAATATVTAAALFADGTVVSGSKRWTGGAARQPGFPLLDEYPTSSREPAELPMRDDSDSGAGSDHGSDRGAHGTFGHGRGPDMYGGATQDGAAAGDANGGERCCPGSDDNSDISGGDGTAPDGEEADYRRGQRLKKLVRMLTSVEVQQHALRFKCHTLAVMFLLTAVGSAIFAVTYRQTSQQISYVDDLYNMGQAARKMMHVAVVTVDMCGMYHRYPQDNLEPTLLGLSNTGADLQFMLSQYALFLADFQVNHIGTNQGFSSVHRELPVKYGLRALWDTPTLAEYDFLQIPDSEDRANAYNTSLTTTVATNTVSLYDIGNKYIARARDVIANGALHNSTLGANDTWGAWVTVLYIVNNSDATLLPGYFQTLDGYAEVVIDAAKRVNLVEVIILVVEGCLLTAACLAYMWYLASKVDTTRFSIYSVFTVVPQALIRTLASQRLDLAEDGETDSEDEDMLAGMNTHRPEPTAPVAVAATPLLEGGEATAGAKSGASGLARSGSTKEAVSAALLFWLPAGGAAAKGKKTHAERRHLKRSLRSVLYLIWPFFAWGVLIILINALCYTDLSTVSSPIMTFTVVNFLQLHFWRIVFTVNLMNWDGPGGPPQAERLTELRAELVVRLAAMKQQYTLMLYGRDALPLETSAHYRLVTSGLADSGGAGKTILFDLSTCMATTKTGCLPVTDIFFPDIMHGMDALVNKFFDMAEQITLGTGLDPESAGPEVAFMWKTRDSMIGAVSLLVDSYQSHVKDLYLSTRKLQTVAFVMTMVLVVAYWWLVRRPFLRQVRAETQRITELLTQLPVEVDVERLVRRALNSGGTALPPSKTKTTADVAGVGPSGASRVPLLLGAVVLEGLPVSDGARDSHAGREGLVTPAWFGGNNASFSKLPLLKAFGAGSTKNKVLPESMGGGSNWVSGAFRGTSPDLGGEDSLTEGSSDQRLSQPTAPPAVRPAVDDGSKSQYAGFELMPRRPPASAADSRKQRRLSWVPLLQPDEPGSPGSPAEQGGSPMAGQGAAAFRRASLGPVPEVTT